MTRLFLSSIGNSFEFFNLPVGSFFAVLFHFTESGFFVRDFRYVFIIAFQFVLPKFWDEIKIPQRQTKRKILNRERGNPPTEGGENLSYLEMKEVLEKQLQLLSERSKAASDIALADLSGQMVNVGKFLLSITPADEKRH